MMAVTTKSTGANQVWAGARGGSFGGITGNGVNVAVIDSGVGFHPALANRMLGCIDLRSSVESSPTAAAAGRACLRRPVRPRHAYRRHHRQQRRRLQSELRRHGAGGGHFQHPGTRRGWLGSGLGRDRRDRLGHRPSGSVQVQGHQSFAGPFPERASSGRSARAGGRACGGGRHRGRGGCRQPGQAGRRHAGGGRDYLAGVHAWLAGGGRGQHEGDGRSIG